MTSRPGPPGDPLWPMTTTEHESLHHDGGPAAEPREPAPRRPARMPTPGRRVVAGGLGILAVIAVAVVGVVVLTGDDEGPELIPVIAVDGWAPYWTLGDMADEISRRDGSMREVSPFWFRATGVDQITFDPNASADLTEKFLDEADEALVVPSIVDGLPAGEMAAILADPATRRRHVNAIVEFAAEGDYDGIDLNYEQFAFADGRDTWEATRPNWVSFVADLAEELRADGRSLTVSIPVVYDAGRT